MSLITAIFCSFCQEPYASSRRPRSGTCGHFICEKCQENVQKCQICGRENAFDSHIPNYQAIGMIEEMERVSVEEMFESRRTDSNRMSVGRCSRPSCCSDKYLRFCVTCAKEAGLLQTLSLGNSTQMWIEKTRAVEAFLVCADCIADGKHDRNHEFLKTSEVPALSEHLDLWNLLIPARVLEKKIEDKENMGNLALLSDFIDKYTLDAIEYSVFLRTDNLKRIEDRIKNHLILNIHQLPELSEAKEKSFQRARSAHLENLKLKERLLMYKKKEIKLYHQLVLDKYNMAEDKEPWEGIKKEFDAIVKKFESISVMRDNQKLTTAEVEEIDKMVEKKMEERIAIRKEEEPFDEEDDEQFLKFRAIKKELEKVNRSIEESKFKLIEADQKLHEFLMNRIETINKSKKDAAKWLGREDSPTEESTLSLSFNKILLYEITDRSLRNDQILLEFLQLIHGYHLISLALARYFPNIPGRSYSDDIYIRMIESSLPERKTFMRELLQATAFSS